MSRKQKLVSQYHDYRTALRDQFQQHEEHKIHSECNEMRLLTKYNPFPSKKFRQKLRVGSSKRETCRQFVELAVSRYAQAHHVATISICSSPTATL